MVCQKCGAKQIFKRKDLICPKCNSINLVPKDIAIKVAQKQIDWFDNKFKQVLNGFDKKRLLVWLAGERERMATSFFLEIPKIELDKFLSVNLLIKKVMEDYELTGKNEADKKKTPELIDLFSVYIQVSERKYLIEEDFGYYIAKNKFDIDNLNKDSLMSNFIFVVNEDYIPVLETFEDNLIMPKKLAEKYYEKKKEEYNKTLQSPRTPTSKTPEETIKELFPTLLSFQGALTKNKLYAKMFNIQNLKDTNISPDFILSFIKDKDIPKVRNMDGLMSCITPHNFKRIIRIRFKEIDKNIAYNNLVMTPDNKDIFSLFINLDNNLLVSPFFIRLIALFYYSLYYKDLFDEEIQRRSDDFEKILVPDRLKEIGFKVKVNETDKKKSTLEIDQIAWKDNKLYVIETKLWDLKSYFEHRRIHNQRERDLKGIVDGKEYSYPKEEEKIKDKPSLLKKIEYVKNNLSKMCEDYKFITEIKGIVITKMCPIIRKYKGVQFLSFKNIPTL